MSLSQAASIRTSQEKEDKHQKTALVVDDSNLDRLILKKLLQKTGFNVYDASNGNSAIEMFEKNKPDIVFMDLYLPGMTGYEITKKIKSLSQHKYTPVIFVTGTTDEDELGDCLDCGGDDFIVKPIREKILHAKTDSLLRVKKMHDQLLDEKRTIFANSEVQKKDMQDAKDIINNIKDPLFYNPGNIKFILEAQYIISGDMLCSAVSPTGKHIVMTGDNTGHGLPAAIGSLIINEVFYTMVRKGFELEALIEEMNEKLYRLLSVDRFFSASFLEIDAEYESLRVWNAGMPDIIITNVNNNEHHAFPSVNMPLGIMSFREEDISPTRVNIDGKSRIYTYSDGITDVFNTDGEIYGDERFLATLTQNEPENCFHNAIQSAEEFREGGEQTDDILFVEINCDKSLIKIHTDEHESNKVKIKPLDWDMSINLQVDALRHSNPVPVLIQAISDFQGLDSHREKLFMILTEMYSNAVEHGILGLDSAIKQKPDGFLEYYQQREDRLANSDDANLSITISNHVEDAKGILSISIDDSGPGFDVDTIFTGLFENKTRSGRGISILKELCRNIEFSNNGSKVNVEYEWND